jgi:hypothetical protein
MKTHPASAELNGLIKKTVKPIARDLLRVADIVMLVLKMVKLLSKNAF